MKQRWFIAFALFAFTLASRAHPLLQDAMWVQFEPTLARVAVNVSLKEISVAQQFPLTPGRPLAASTLDRALQQQGDYVLKHLALSVGTNVLAGQVISLTRPTILGDPERTCFQYELVFPYQNPPPEVTFFNTMLAGHPYAAGTAWDVSYVIRAKRAGDAAATSWLLGFQQPATIPTGWDAAPTPVDHPVQAQAGRTFCEYFKHGVTHILTGYDHLLFISALVLATRRFWDMVKVIAAFTLAHSLTLTLCVFGIFRLPSYVVEPVIALSIVFVALENLLWPERARSWVRLAVAFGFGLVHGLGFAGGLLDAMAGLPASGTWIALGAFSLGVEIGHQLVVLPLFALLMLSRQKFSDPVCGTWLRYGTSAISCAGVYYLCVAVHEQFFLR